VRSPDPFLESTALLVATDAVAGLLTLEDGRYVMQLRDLKPNIFYPGHWGLFGGAIDSGESERDALCRELQEELAFRPRSMTRFAGLDFDLSAIGVGKVSRAVYEVPVSTEEFAAFKLREGLAYDALTARTILTEVKVTPYDSFAIWLHQARGRLSSVDRDRAQGLPRSFRKKRA
jgi:8-oxo-dGTP pyrophosphatase MutT (NUDIX family)